MIRKKSKKSEFYLEKFKVKDTKESVFLFSFEENTYEINGSKTAKIC